MNPDAIKDGGAAYPVAMSEQTHSNQNCAPFQAGMSLRDFFAAHATECDLLDQAEVIRAGIDIGILPDGWRVKARWMHADAMIAARES